MSRPVRVVFDAHAIAPQRSGIGDYSFYLLRELLESYADEVELTLFSEDRLIPVQSMVDVDIATLRNAQGSLYSIRHQRLLPSLLKDGGYDLFHTPDYAIPLFNTHVPMVSTIHDIVPIAMPEKLNKSKKVKLLRLFRWYIQRTLARSRAIITVSEFSRREILKHFRCPPEKVHAIHNGLYLDRVTSFMEGDRIPGVPEGKYFLYVGRQEPYKGIRELLEAFAAVKQDITPHVSKLLIVGAVDNRYPWAEVSRELALEDDIVFSGYLSERQLSWAYTHAVGLVFPSFYEGFGVPPLDAMVHEIPVAASNRASIPEVAKDAALFFDPEDSKTLQDALKNLALNGNLRSDLIAKGRGRVNDFSWEFTAQKTVEVYRKALHR